MTLDELEAHEQIALVGLLGLMARIDLNTSSDEIELFERVASQLGLENFTTAAGKAAQLPDGQAILRCASEVTRQEAREVIYELLYDMAIRETIVDREAELLDRIAELWQLPQRIGTRD